MIKSVKETIEKYSLLKKGDKVLVALSGGADSMCLTHILYMLAEELKITVSAAHVNHNIRGEEALSDAREAELFAKRLGIDFHLKSVDVKKYAVDNNISEELAGRKLRYDFFEELQRKCGYTKIATAHNRNDNAETLIMNFMRGATIQGLCGIPVKRGDIIRPLLCTSREEIEEHCKKYELPYVTDSTNLEAIYTRNKIRLELIPQIESDFNPNFINTITKNAQIISAENDYIEKQVKEGYAANVKDGVLSLEFIKNNHYAIVRRIIMQMLLDESGSVADISSTAIEDIIKLCEKGESGKNIALPYGIIAEIEYGNLVITARRENISEFEYILKPDVDVFIAELNKYARLENCDAKENDGAIYFSADSVDNIVLRNRCEGDVFTPSGMNGRKKLKNLFIDEKIPRAKRSIIPVITVDSKIAAVGNLRCDSNFEFGKNKILLKIRIIGQEEKSIGTKTI